MRYSLVVLSRRVGIAAACCLGGLVLVPGVAGAAFPGVDGPLVYQSTETGIPPCSPYTSSELFSIQPVADSTPSQVDCNGHTDQHPFVSPDGTQVVFASNRGGGSGAFQLYLKPLSAPNSAATDVSYPPNAGVDDYPSWAPASPANQGTIIFQRTLSGGDPQLYIENVNTPSSPAVPVFSAPTGFSDTEPVYDPSNANEIAFVRQAAGGPQQIYTYNLSTPSVPPVNLSASDGDSASNDSKPDFAPYVGGNGQEIVFQSDRSTANAMGGPCEGTQLYTMTDQPGSTITPVFATGSPPSEQQTCPKVNGVNVATENPVFSPEGDKIAYDEPGPNAQDVYTFEVSLSDDIGVGSPTDLVVNNYNTDAAPNWAPVSPGSSTPESPNVLLLPLVGAAVAGAGFLVVRRRRRIAG